MRARAIAMLLLAASCRGEARSEQSAGAPPHSAPARPLVEGDIAPEFSALAQTGHNVTLSGFRQKPVAVYVCAAGLDDACTEVIVELRDQWLRLNRKLGMVLVITPTSFAENLAFSTEHELPLLLLTDAAGDIAKSYGITPAPDGSGASARGFLIGSDGKVARVFDRLTAEHVRELLTLLQ